MNPETVVILGAIGIAALGVSGVVLATHGRLAGRIEAQDREMAELKKILSDLLGAMGERSIPPE